MFVPGLSRPIEGEEWVADSEPQKGSVDLAALRILEERHISFDEGGALEEELARLGVAAADLHGVLVRTEVVDGQAYIRITGWRELTSKERSHLRRSLAAMGVEEKESLPGAAQELVERRLAELVAEREL